MILKQEGFIETDRRNGAKIVSTKDGLEEKYFEEKIEDELKLLLIEAKLKGYSNEDLLEVCKNMIIGLQVERLERSTAK